MSEGGGGPIKGGGMVSSMFNAVGEELGQDVKIGVKQVTGMGKPQQPKNLSQTQQIKQIQRKQQLEKEDQDKIAKLSAEIGRIVYEHQQKPKTWQEEMVARIKKKIEEEKMLEEQEKKKKEDAKKQQQTVSVALPGSAKKMPGLFGGKKKAQPLVVTQAVNKEIGRQAKG